MSEQPVKKHLSVIICTVNIHPGFNENGGTFSIIPLMEKAGISPVIYMVNVNT